MLKNGNRKEIKASIKMIPLKIVHFNHKLTEVQFIKFYMFKIRDIMVQYMSIYTKNSKEKKKNKIKAGLFRKKISNSKKLEMFLNKHKKFIKIYN